MKLFSKRLYVVLVVGVVATFLLSPLNVYAGLVPCGNTVNDECTLCDLQNVAVGFVDLVITLSTMVATLLFVQAGILYVFSPANPTNIGKAHKIFLTTLVGFVIILASWLIISLLMDTLYTGGSFGSWNNVLCEGGADIPRPTPPTPGTPGVVVTTTPNIVDPTSNTITGGVTGVYESNSNNISGTMSDVDARAALSEHATISPLVTTFEGVRKTTVSGANNFADFSGLSKGDLIYTSGVDMPGAHAETGDYTHIKGVKIDYEDTQALTKYITSNPESPFTQTGARSNGDPIYTATVEGQKIEAARESTHWDFTYFPI